MTEMKDKAREIEYLYLMKEDCKRIYGGCDLGDSVKISAYQYPHVLQRPHMSKFYSDSAYQKLMDALELILNLEDPYSVRYSEKEQEMAEVARKALKKSVPNE